MLVFWADKAAVKSLCAFFFSWAQKRGHMLNNRGFSKFFFLGKQSCCEICVCICGRFKKRTHVEQQPL